MNCGEEVEVEGIEVDFKCQDLERSFVISQEMRYWTVQQLIEWIKDETQIRNEYPNARNLYIILDNQDGVEQRRYLDNASLVDTHWGDFMVGHGLRLS